jgi:hypothetical protein
MASLPIKTPPSKFCTSQYPEEIESEILSSLNPREIGRLLQTNKNFEALLYKDGPWKKLLVENFGPEVLIEVQREREGHAIAPAKISSLYIAYKTYHYYVQCLLLKNTLQPIDPPKWDTTCPGINIFHLLEAYRQNLLRADNIESFLFDPIEEKLSKYLDDDIKRELVERWAEHFTKNPFVKICLLKMLAQTYIKANKLEEGIRLLNRAQEIIALLPDDDKRKTYVLYSIVQIYYTEVKKLPEAIKIARQIPDLELKLEALNWLADQCREKDKTKAEELWSEAEDFALKELTERGQDGPLKNIFNHYCQERVLDAAERIALAIPHNQNELLRVVRLRIALSNSPVSYANAERIAVMIPENTLRSEALEEIALGFRYLHNFDEAKRVAELIPDRIRREQCLAEIASSIPRWRKINDWVKSIDRETLFNTSLLIASTAFFIYHQLQQTIQSQE